MPHNLWDSLANHGHPLLEVISWIAGPISALAVITAALTWTANRWQDTRTNPYGLRISMDVAIGGPGHVVFILNQRTTPVMAELYGVMPAHLAPRLGVSRIVPFDRIDTRALTKVADVVFPNPPAVVEPGDYRFFRTLLGPESLLTPAQYERFQSPDATEEDLIELGDVMSAFDPPEPRYPQWASRIRLVPFVQVLGVGYIFGKPTRGPFSELGGYRGYPCAKCSHDFHEHVKGSKRHWRRLDLTSIGCQECSCPQFTGKAAPRPPRDRFR